MMKAVLLLVALTATLCKAGPVSDAVAAMPELASLLAALKYAGQASTLDMLPTTQKLTLFAPDNDAFAALLADINATSLTAIPVPIVTKVLQYHIVPSGALKAADVKDGAKLATALPGHSVTTKVSGGSVTIIPDNPLGTDAEVIKADVTIPGYSAVIHIIDSVLLPDIPEL